ncbi:MAG TPA: hypothetical protein VGE41_05100, partial [Verrucomicrobiae bacterium]
RTISPYLAAFIDGGCPATNIEVGQFGVDGRLGLDKQQKRSHCSWQSDITGEPTPLDCMHIGASAIYDVQ